MPVVVKKADDVKNEAIALLTPLVEALVKMAGKLLKWNKPQREQVKAEILNSIRTAKDKDAEAAAKLMAQWRKLPKAKTPFDHLTKQPERGRVATSASSPITVSPRTPYPPLTRRPRPTPADPKKP